MTAVFNWFKSLNSFFFLIAIVLLLMGVSFTIEQIAILIDDGKFISEAEQFVSMLRGKDSRAEELGTAYIIFLWFYVVVLCPFFETLIFQWAPIRFINNNFQISRVLTISISACLFGMAHLVNPIASFLYLFAIVSAGVVLAFGFVVSEEGSGNSFWLIAIAHSAFNFLCLFLD
jgi:hypothetical protein